MFQIGTLIAVLLVISACAHSPVEDQRRQPASIENTILKSTNMNITLKGSSADSLQTKPGGRSKCFTCLDGDPAEKLCLTTYKKAKPGVKFDFAGVFSVVEIGGGGTTVSDACAKKSGEKYQPILDNFKNNRSDENDFALRQMLFGEKCRITEMKYNEIYESGGRSHVLELAELALGAIKDGSAPLCYFEPQCDHVESVSVRMQSATSSSDKVMIVSKAAAESDIRWEDAQSCLRKNGIEMILDDSLVEPASYRPRKKLRNIKDI